MRATFRTKLLASYLALVAIVELIALLVLNQSLGLDLTHQLDQRLEQQARGAASWVSARRTAHQGPDSSYDRQASRLAGVVRAWVTILDERGVVVGDSDFPAHHSATPPETVPSEIAAAQRGVLGRSTRESPKHDRVMHLVAVPAERGLIVRLGVPRSEIEDTITNMRNRLLSASALTFLVAVVLGLMAAGLVARPLRAMTQSAVRLSKGDYEVRLAPSAPDEFGTLAESLNSLAGQLKERIGELTRERDQLTVLLAAMVEGVLVSGPDRRIRVENPSARRILGAGGPLVGRSLDELLPGPRFDPIRAALEADGSQPDLHEVELTNSGQEPRTLLISVRPLQTEAGRGLILVLHDVTELSRVEVMRRDFVANVSHELRTPLTAVQGFAETLLERNADPETVREFLEAIHRNTERMGHLVNDLLRLADLDSRPAAGRPVAPVLLERLVEDVASSLRVRLDQAGVILDRSIPAGLRVLGDAVEIEQVLGNLIDNAIKYGKRGGRIGLSAVRSAETHRAQIVVADDGPGIAAEHLKRIFERFYRVDPGRSRALGGTGLGLAIVERLVQAMGGTIRAESELGRGTRFVVELPLAPE